MFGVSINFMPLVPTWSDIVVRLVATLAAGTLIGLNRQVGGHNAGFRTIVLVGLAACLAMIQANMLLSLTGKTAESFVRTDIMRFPLGVLTGVGFIGGGAILRRGELVTGLTTAATLWIMTVIGLAIGGGQVAIGLAFAVVAYIVLSPLKAIDNRLTRLQKARLTLRVPKTPAIPELEALLGRWAARCDFAAKRRTPVGEEEISFEVCWRARRGDRSAEEILSVLEDSYEVIVFDLEDSAG